MLQLQAVVALNKSPFESGLSSISAAVSNAASAMSMAFGGVAGEILAMSRAFGPMGTAVAVMKESINVGAGFEQQMANVASVSGLTGAELVKVSDAALEMAKTTRYTATQAGDALYSLASAGINTADAMAATLKPALLLAGATLSNTALATETMTAALANFQIPATQATRIADQFVGAIASSPATMERMADAFKYAGPAAAGFGISLEKAVAEVAAFHIAGLRGEMAGTAFRMALIQLSQESQKSGSVIGQALGDWKAGTDGITGAVQRLNAAGIDTEVVIQTLGARAGPAMAAMMQLGSEAMTELAIRIQNAADVSKMYETQINTLSGRFAIFKSAVEDVFITLYGHMSPALTEITKKATEVADAFGDLLRAMFAGDWEKVRAMITGAFYAVVDAGAQAIETIKEFVSALLTSLGLNSTIGALKNMMTALSDAFESVSDVAGGAFSKLSDVSWSDVLKSALETLDDALSLILAGITGVIQAVDWLIEGWQSLSAETKTVIGVVAGTAGLTVAVLALDAALAKLGALLMATVIKAMASFAAASASASASFAAFPLATTAAVAGAAAFGAGLGLLIRQIPGVAEAMDDLAVRTLNMLGVFVEEDEALKRNQEYWKRQREVRQDEIKAKDAARSSGDEYIRNLQAQNDEIGEWALAQVAAEKALSQTAEKVEKISPFLAEMNQKQRDLNSAMNNATVGMIAMGPVMSTVMTNTGKMADATQKAAEPMKQLGNTLGDISKISVGIKIELPQMTNLMIEVWEKFFLVLNKIKNIDVKVNIELPRMSDQLVEIWDSFFQSLNTVAAKDIKIAIDLPPMLNKTVEIWESFFKMLSSIASREIKIAIDLPKMTDSIAGSWQKFFSVFKGGAVQIPNVSNIEANIASIDKNLGVLAGLKGIVWA